MSTTTEALERDTWLRTAPADQLLAAVRRERAAAPPPPLKTTADMFEAMAMWSRMQPDDAQDGIADMVAQLTPHLTVEDSALWWEELRSCLAEWQKAEDGEHPGDVDELTWAESRRAEVDVALERLTGESR
jgi:hypothetical protein